MARTAEFTVTLSKASTKVVTVDYATIPGSATPPDDYTPTSGTLIFSPGETSKKVVVPVRDDDPELPQERFSVKLTNPVNATLGPNSEGICILPGEIVVPSFLDRFNWIYEAVHNNANGYFGPQTGPNAFSVPRHIPEVDSRIINEAPDYGGETVSETASFWIGLEAWKGELSEDWSGYNNAWAKIEQFYIPSPTNQPVDTYNPNSPADYIPEADTPNQYPRLAEPWAPKGVDPLAAELEATYGTKRMYLMHWIIDVEGAYGFHNGDGATKIVYINTYERGLQESSFETVTHPCWGDWNNGGSEFGYEPLFTKGKQWYEEAPYDWGKKWSYTNAPDAEVRALQWAFRADRFAAAQGKHTQIASITEKAKKMGDYLRYNLFDKYFRKIGSNRTQGGTGYDACHYLINWYAAWGGEIPETGMTGSWSYRIGCSEAHHGYQGPDVAYFLATGGGGFTPNSPSSGDVWLESLRRQIEMIRWLQSPEGPIAGGVTNSMYARYYEPTDGRQLVTFYGMYYTYAPVWHDPPSNNWVGFQAWGHGRTAHLFMEVADKTTPLANEIRPKLEVILDRLVKWFMDEAELTEDGSFTLPSNLSWVSNTAIPGQTTTSPNLEGVYEYLPSLTWDGTGDQSAFWNPSGVPNPNLHCTISSRGTDLGVAASLAVMLALYGRAKQLMGKFDTPILGSSHTPRDAVVLAKELLDRIWLSHRDGVGITIPEERADYLRLNDSVYVPSIFSGTMPNGDPIEPDVKFIDLRSFLRDDPKWPEVQAYITNPTSAPVPVFTYHRFWAQAEYAIGCGVMHKYFQSLF